MKYCCQLLEQFRGYFNHFEFKEDYFENELDTEELYV